MADGYREIGQGNRRPILALDFVTIENQYNNRRGKSTFENFPGGFFKEGRSRRRERFPFMDIQNSCPSISFRNNSEIQLLNQDQQRHLLIFFLQISFLTYTHPSRCYWVANANGVPHSNQQKSSLHQTLFAWANLLKTFLPNFQAFT